MILKPENDFIIYRCGQQVVCIFPKGDGCMSTEQNQSEQASQLRTPCCSTFLQDDRSSAQSSCWEGPVGTARPWGLGGMGGSALSDPILLGAIPEQERGSWSVKPCLHSHSIPKGRNTFSQTCRCFRGCWGLEPKRNHRHTPVQLQEP